MHDIRDQAFCCVEVLQGIQGRFSVQPIGCDYVVMNWTSKAGAMCLVSFPSL